VSAKLSAAEGWKDIDGLLELLELKGSVVTLDAMSCQKNKGKGAGYMISLGKLPIRDVDPF